MLRRLARHAWLAPVLLAGLSLFISACLSVAAPLPIPQFHDEFSYLLAGDTFAHGRLTNPQHSLWKFFETYQVLSQPTYMSKYPPVQGVFLALGQALFGDPIVGVWVCTALACAAAWWALAGLVPRRWAIVGAMVVAVHPLLLRWNWSYWGGAASMLGGCLVVGAIARFGKSTTITTGAVLGLGAGILLNSRPFEGAVLTAACITSALFCSPGRKSVFRAGLRSYALAIASVVVCVIVVWTAYYNHRVTGSATQFPYLLYERQYAVTAPLIFARAPTSQPQYNHSRMRDYYLNWELPRYQQQRSIGGFIRTLGDKSWSLLRSYFASPVLIVPVGVSLLLLGRDRTLRRMTVIAAVSIAAALGGLWFFPHYAAPAAIVVLFIAIQGLRYLRARSRTMYRVALALHVVAFVVSLAALVRAKPDGAHALRASILEQLHQAGGHHLIVVRDRAAYMHFDWVYNDADIDSSPVVWARDMGSDANRELLTYFHDRTVWLLEVEVMAELIPYPR